MAGSINSLSLYRYERAKEELEFLCCHLLLSFSTDNNLIPVDFLHRYRDTKYSLMVVMRQMEAQLRLEYSATPKIRIG